MQRDGQVALGERVPQPHLPDRVAAEPLCDRLEARLHLGGHPGQHVHLLDDECRRAAERVAERLGAARERRPALGVGRQAALGEALAQGLGRALVEHALHREGRGDRLPRDVVRCATEPARDDRAVGILTVHAEEARDRLDIVGQRRDQAHAGSRATRGAAQASSRCCSRRRRS